MLCRKYFLSWSHQEKNSVMKPMHPPVTKSSLLSCEYLLLPPVVHKKSVLIEQNIIEHLKLEGTHKDHCCSRYWVFYQLHLCSKLIFQSISGINALKHYLPQTHCTKSLAQMCFCLLVLELVILRLLCCLLPCLQGSVIETGFLAFIHTLYSCILSELINCSDFRGFPE